MTGNGATSSRIDTARMASGLTFITVLAMATLC